MRFTFAIATAIAIGCTASAQDLLDHAAQAQEALDQAEAAVDAAVLTAPDDPAEAVELLKAAKASVETAKAQIDAALIVLDSDPDPDPPAGDLPPLPAKGERPWCFILGQVDKGITYSRLDHPDIDGLSIRASWKKVHLSPDTYNWDFIDSQIAHCKTRGKLYTLRILMGNDVPFWVYQRADNANKKRVDGRLFIYPDDPELQEWWGKFMAELAARYGDDPDLVMVHVPSFWRGAEMLLPGNKRDWKESEIGPYWADRILKCSLLFPDKIISLNRNPWPGSPTAIETTKTLGDQALFQMNSLDNDIFGWDAGYGVLKGLSDDGYNLGFQMICPSSNTGRFDGRFDQVVERAWRDGAQFFEIYQGDYNKLPDFD